MVVDLISQNSDTSNPVPLVFYWLVQCEETIRTSARRRVLLILLHVCSPPAPPSLPAPPGGLKGVLLQIQVHAGEKALPAVLCCFRDVWNVPVGPKRHIEVVSCGPPPPPENACCWQLGPLSLYTLLSVFSSLPMFSFGSAFGGGAAQAFSCSSPAGSEVKLMRGLKVELQIQTGSAVMVAGSSMNLRSPIQVSVVKHGGGSIML